MEKNMTKEEVIVRVPLTYAPTNEAGVIFLFGAMARELGFAVTLVQAEFPDCEAMRESGAEPVAAATDRV
jgi:hypothetical protein